ncbi:MAG TPA: hypothetical protein VGC65_09165, partial [Bacteroidia bacterium]
MEPALKSHKTQLSEIWFDEAGILWLLPTPGSEIDAEEVKACFAIYREMGINEDNKVFQIIDASLGASMNREG